MVEEQKYDAAGRLFSVLAALLLAGSYGLTKHDLFRVVEPYAQDLAKGLDFASLEKKFERDKETLKRNGFNLQYREVDLEPRYYIPSKNFAFSKLTELNPRQVQLLNLASEIWAQSALSSDAGRAAIRLRGLGLATANDSLLNVAPRLQVHDPAFIALTDAIATHTVVAFDYRKPGDSQVERRVIEPWALVNIDGQWLVQCFDRKRGAPRNFLLKRIVSSVKPVIPQESSEPVTFTAPSAESKAAAAADLAALTANQIAKFEVKNGSEAWFRFIEGKASDGEWIAHQTNFMDVHLLAEELRVYGSDVRILEPESLAKAVRGGFEKVANDHA